MKQIILVLALLISSSVFAQDMYDVCPLKVGEEIPNTVLVDEAKNQVELVKLAAIKPTVLIFYRGAWCGYCTKHLAELNEVKAEIEALGYQIFGVTVDQAEKLPESNEKSASEIKVYSDANLETISAFGLNWKVGDELFAKYKNEYKLDLEAWSGEDHHGLPVPAIFVVKENIVEFQYVNPNYKTRLKAETLLAVLKTL